MSVNIVVHFLKPRWGVGSVQGVIGGVQGIVGGIVDGAKQGFSIGNGLAGGGVVGTVVGVVGGVFEGVMGAFGNNSGQKDGEADSSGTKIICVELYRQGLLEPDIYEADEAFGRYLYTTNIDALKGYQFWAKPVVRMMRSSKIITKIVYFFAKPWTQEMAHTMGVSETGNTIGKIFMHLGIPLCEFIGKAIRYVDQLESIITLAVVFSILYLFINRRNKNTDSLREKISFSM